MKIVHTDSGFSYQLAPGTQLEVDRTNPFFNEWGEQTVPVTLPDTDINQRILKFPDPKNKEKISHRINATIEDGAYFMNCRQAILSSKRKEGITTSFYMNEGSFYDRVTNIRLETIFGEEAIPGVRTVTQGIAFCKSMLTTPNPNYAIFPVYINSGDTVKWINRVEFMNDKGDYQYTQASEMANFNNLGFYNEFAREEVVDDYSIRLDAGYYITPFIRANYLLRRVFSYFGYTLLANPFDNYPFSDMVFINNTIDSIVNGDIRIAHLVPDCLCTTLLNVFRKKFFCEFIPDEINKTISVKFFKDVVKATPRIDLTPYLTSELYFEYPNNYKQIKISSKENISYGNSFDSLSEVQTKYPTIYCDPKNGNYYRTGFSTSRYTELVAVATLPYYAGGNLEVISIESPDSIFPMIYENSFSPSTGSTSIPQNPNDRPSSSPIRIYSIRKNIILPLIGEGKTLNSTIKLDKPPTEETEGSSNDSGNGKNNEQAPMLSFFYMCNQGFYLGTATNYSSDGIRLSDYSLYYNGPDGIFERFYRDYDNLLRNSLQTVKGDFLLSQHQKLTLPSYEKIIVSDSELFLNKLKYQIGGKNEPVESELLTCNLYEPVQTAILEHSRIPNPLYKWKIKYDYKTITEEEYNNSEFKTSAAIPIIYPPAPTEEQYNAAGKHYYRSVAIKRGLRGGGVAFYLYTYFLKPVTLDTPDSDRS